MKRPTLAGLSILFFALACSLGNSAVETPTPDIDLLSTAVSETLTAMTTPEGEAPEASTPTVETPQASSTETPEAQGFLPAGIMAWMPGGVVTIYDPQAQPIADYALPDLTFPGPSFIHYAGPFGPGATDGPLVYFSLEGGEALKVLDGGNSNVYTAAPGLIAMVGAPAQPVIAYSLFVVPQTGYDTSSELYVGTLDAPPVDPILTITNEEGYALYPLGVEAVDGQPVGVWYTTQLWGIGNVAFAPQRGLYYFDIASGQVEIYLPATESNDMGEFSYAPAGFSSDRSWVAYTMHGPNVAPYSMFWQPVDDPDQVKSVMPGINYDMGAGFGVFSPNNQYLAWDTANSGTQMGMVTYYLQINSTDGVSGSFSLFPTAGSFLAPDLVFAWPVGWLDNEVLLLEGQLADGSTHVMHFGPASSVVSLDGSGEAIEAEPFVPGEFLGFVYP